MSGKLPAGPTLMLVTDRHRSGDQLLATIDRAVDSGVDIVNIREKDLDRRERVKLAYDIVAAVDGRAHVVVNSDADVARELGIGLHLPEAAPPLGDAGALGLSGDVLVGRSVHAAEVAADGRLDYLLFGHVYASGSKSGLQPKGLEALEQLVANQGTPVLAIGGITPANAAAAIERGAQGIAVIGAIFDAQDPRSATRALRAAIDRAAAARVASR